MRRACSATSKASCFLAQETRICSQSLVDFAFRSAHDLVWIDLILVSSAAAQASQMVRWVSSWILRKLENFFQSDLMAPFRAASFLSLGSLMVKSILNR